MLLRAMPVSKPKILCLDIETAPAQAYVWRLFDENIGLDQLITPSRIICVGAKWLGKKEIFYADELGEGGPSEMFRGIHSLLSEADAVITYNGDKFDLPKLDGAFVEYGLGPIPPITSIDLLKTVKKLGVQSNRLAFIAPHLKIGEKTKNAGFSLWADWLRGDERAIKKMRQYNIQDVRLLDKLYKVLKPYIKNHPRLKIQEKKDRPSCRVCGGTHVQFRGDYKTKELVYDRFQCMSCMSWNKQRRAKTKDA